ncbi:LOW QUALITY PROTEIN: reverse transcriptase [Phytophthora megakarya]|uniref:Reverse transcriptase n=1 Tax=Phytophthora megakarya TaxID=4795 RepID=A0A225VE33_9STRA|nr:LOW QUALITY PROTEIN: reverse transcriptase [Phytophthora megakarya]
MTQLNRQRELVARLKSVKYLHAVREYNASADSLATEALENKSSSVTSDEPRLAELRSLNRIQEVIYAPITESSADEPSVSIAQAQVQTRHLRHMEPSQRSGTVLEPRRKNFFDFVRRDIGDLMVTTRLQAKTKPKRVRFADETSVTGGEDVTQREEANGVPTEDSVRLEAEFSRVTAPNVLRGEESTLTYRAARDAWKMSDHFVLSEDNVLYYVGTRPLKSEQQQENTMLRLVVPSTMIQDVLQNCHDSLEGGHQWIAPTFYRLDYYWIGLYADVTRHARSCPDCSSSKSQPTIRGYSPRNILAERPFQVVSMDYVIPLPKSQRGNTALLLFQCAFTGYVIGKAMADTTALRVAQAFEKCVYRRFGAPSLIRHDRDPRSMSEVFQSFTEMMQSRSRATLSYRSQANGQQERSVKPVMQSVRVYAEDSLQQDWDEIAEKLIFATNNPMDTTRKYDPFSSSMGGMLSPHSRRCPRRSNEDSVDSQMHWHSVEK